MLDGYKTTLSGVAAIIAGVGMIVKCIAETPINFSDMWQGALVIIGGLTTLGVGGKLQKLINAINGQPTPPSQ